jgi:hypothetical protein
MMHPLFLFLLFLHTEFEKYGKEMTKQRRTAATPYGLVLQNCKEIVRRIANRLGSWDSKCFEHQADEANKYYI